MSIFQKRGKYVVSVYNSNTQKQDHVGTFTTWKKAVKADSAAKAKRRGRPKPDKDFNADVQALLNRKWELVDESL